MQQHFLNRIALAKATEIAATTRKRTISLAALAPTYAPMTVLLISPIAMCRYTLPTFALIPLTYAVTSNRAVGNL